MIDTRETIRNLETINAQSKCPHVDIKDAVKVCKMWNWFKDNNGDLTIMYPHHETFVRELMHEAEVKFLGSKPKTLTEKIESIIDVTINALLGALNDKEEDV